MIVIGVAFHAPDYIEAVLKKRVGYHHSQIRAFAGKPARVLLFTDSITLRNNLPTINSRPFRDCVCILFADVITLYNYTNIIPYDYRLHEDFHLNGFDIIHNPDNQVFKRTSDATVTYERRNFLYEVWEQSQKAVGILSRYMTFCYSTPSATHQTPLKNLMCDWICAGGDEADLNARIAALPITVSVKQVTRMKSILLTEDATAYKKAVKALAHVEDVQSKEFIKIVNTFGVSAYEIRYMRAINSRRQ